MPVDFVRVMIRHCEPFADGRLLDGISDGARADDSHLVLRVAVPLQLALEGLAPRDQLEQRDPKRPPREREKKN